MQAAGPSANLKWSDMHQAKAMEINPQLYLGLAQIQNRFVARQLSGSFVSAWTLLTLTLASFLFSFFVVVEPVGGGSFLQCVEIRLV